MLMHRNTYNSRPCIKVSRRWT